jgi:hypothetical protein
MTRKRGDAYNNNYLLQGSPAGSSTYIENYPRTSITSAACVIGATGIMTSVAVPIQAGELITNITFRSGTTAADTPLNWGVALYSSASTPALLAQSADQTTTAWAASTTKTVALATPQLISTPGVYYAALWMKATAQVTLTGMILPHLDLSTGLLTTEKFLSASSGTTLTTTAPSTIASPTKLVGVPYVVLT